MIWDVWAIAAETEQDVLAHSDIWATLLPIIRRVCAERMRVWRREAFSSDFAHCARPQNASSRMLHSGSPDHLGSENDPYEWMEAALASLPEKQRIAVDFRYRWNMPYDAIAAAIESTEGAARVCVTRALSRLRRLAVAV